mgnify:CR=1 FL=1
MSTQAIITLVVFVAVIVLLIWKPIHPIVIGACIPTGLADFIGEKIIGLIGKMKRV